MIIRLAELSDMQAIGDFQRSERQDHPLKFFWDDAVWNKSIKSNQIYVASDDSNKILGFLRFLKREDRISILYLHIGQEEQKKQIASDLMQEIIKIAESENLPIVLSLSPANDIEISFFKKFGFVEESSDDPETEGLSVGMERQPFAHIMPKP